MFKDFNFIIYFQLRLVIIFFLVVNGKFDFKEIKEVIKVILGNISVQLKKLEEVEYICIIKGFFNNYQYMVIEIMLVGIKVFEEYV